MPSAVTLAHCSAPGPRGGGEKPGRTFQGKLLSVRTGKDTEEGQAQGSPRETTEPSRKRHKAHSRGAQRYHRKGVTHHRLRDSIFIMKKGRRRLCKCGREKLVSALHKVTSVHRSLDGVVRRLERG